MIPRYQRILFYILTGAILLMATFTIRERQKIHDRFLASYASGPYIEPVNASSEAITLDLAIDADASILSAERNASLPQEPSLRAKALIERLIAEYALPDSSHPLQAGNAVNDVFLLKPPTDPKRDLLAENPKGTLAVVDLRGPFVEKHPSGVEVETLTIQSIIGTLHENFPEIAQGRFLVDGQQRDTLAGHVDMGRIYDAIDTTTGPVSPSAAPDQGAQP